MSDSTPDPLESVAWAFNSGFGPLVYHVHDDRRRPTLFPPVCRARNIPR